MSALVIAGDTSGSVTLQAPAVSGSTVLTLQGTSGLVVAPATAGTSGQALLSAGSGAAPTWGVPAGGLTFISSQTVTGTVASVDFTTGISATYDNYYVVFSNFRLATSSRLALRLRQGVTFATADYINFNIYAQNGGVLGTEFSLTNTFILSNNGGTPDTNGYWSGYFTLSSANNSTRRVPVVNGYCACVGNTAASSTLQSFSGGVDVAGAITGFQLLARSGNLSAGGTVALYGMAKS